MKILLIQPPVRDFYETGIRVQPIGLCYIKAAIGHFHPTTEVIVKDYHRGYGRKTTPPPKELSFLKKFYPVADKSPFSTFHQYYHFGQSFETIEEEIDSIGPDVVGISSLFTPYFREALEIARRVKKRSNIPVILGGAHVSEAPESVLSSSCVDYILRGEGERPMVEFLEFLQGARRIENVSALGFKRKGKLFFNPLKSNYPIDSLPFPDLNDFSPDRYTLSGRPMTAMITSRGCPHRCSFCSVHATFGKEYRARSLNNVFEEVERRYREGYRVIDFEDDNLTFRRENFKEFCHRLIRRFPGREMTFVAMNGMSYMSLDRELLELMHQAGFNGLNLSLVSTDRHVLDRVRRPHTLNTYRETVTEAVLIGLPVVSYQILGLPGESLSSMIRTMAFHARLPVLIGASPYYRSPRSPLADSFDFSEADYVQARLTALGIETAEFTRQETYTLFLTARIINFLKGLPLPTSIKLSELLGQSWEDHRTRIGIKLLGDLRQSGTLHFWTKRGRIPNPNFRFALFRQVMRLSRHITCRNGKEILLDLFAEDEEDCRLLPEESIAKPIRIHLAPEDPVDHPGIGKNKGNANGCNYGQDPKRLRAGGGIVDG